jgi:hypothetical protein
MIIQELLKEYLHYDPETGIFTWIKDRPSYNCIGKIAGSLKNNYRIIKFCGKDYLEHRLAWFYVYGEWPKNQVDHINGIKSDNRISNLRDVTNRQNALNKKRHRGGRLPGTAFKSGYKKYSSEVLVEGKRKLLGYFDTEQEAHEAYMAYVQEHNLI